MIDTSNWVWFPYKHIFTIKTYKGKNILNSLKGNIPFVSASAANNGITTFVDSDEVENGGKITVARNGSVCSAFFQSQNFCASPDDIRIFELKGHKLNKYIALFLCTLIEKEKYRFAYGRKFGTKRMKEQRIKLPVDINGKPDWRKIEQFTKDSIIPQLSSKAKAVWEGKYNTAPILNKEQTLDIKKWQWYRYDDIFDIRKGFYNKKPENHSGSDIPFIGAIENNNGVSEYYNVQDIEEASKTGDDNNVPLSEKIFEGNCITVSNNGSVGYAFYQAMPFTCTHDVNPLYLHPKWKKDLNPYIAMFLCSLIEKERYRWTYGRKWRPKRMPSSLIKLPVTSEGVPDWQFMEDYIKSLPYSNNISLTKNKNKDSLLGLDLHK